MPLIGTCNDGKSRNYKGESEAMEWDSVPPLNGTARGGNASAGFAMEMASASEGAGSWAWRSYRGLGVPGTVPAFSKDEAQRRKVKRRRASQVRQKNEDAKYKKKNHCCSKQM